MNDDLQDLELQLIRLKVTREALALEDDIERRTRNRSVSQGVANIGRASGDLTLRVWTTTKVVICYLIALILLLIVGIAVIVKPNSVDDWLYRLGFYLAYAAIPILVIATYYGVKQWLIWPRLVLVTDKRSISTRITESFTGFWLYLARSMMLFVIIIDGVIIFSSHRSDPSDIWVLPLLWAVWIACLIGLPATFLKK